MKFTYIGSGDIVTKIRSDLDKGKNLLDAIRYRDFESSKKGKEIASRSFESYMENLRLAHRAERWVLMDFIRRGVEEYDNYGFKIIGEVQDVKILLQGLKDTTIHHIISKYKLISGYNLETMLKSYRATRKSGIISFELDQGISKKDIIEKIIQQKDQNDLIILVKS
ncbi:MAG: hypothetical protein QXH89_01040 [Candidatus Anstonellales archaeon]